MWYWLLWFTYFREDHSLCFEIEAKESSILEIIPQPTPVLIFHFALQEAGLEVRIRASCETFKHIVCPVRIRKTNTNWCVKRLILLISSILIIMKLAATLATPWLPQLLVPVLYRSIIFVIIIVIIIWFDSDVYLPLPILYASGPVVSI